MPSAWNVTTNSVNGSDELAKFHSRLHFPNPLLWTLPFAKAADVCCSGFQRVAEVRRDLLPGGIDFLLTHATVLAFEAVELARVAEQGGVAALVHVVHDFAYRFFDAREIEGSAIGEALERCSISFAVNDSHLALR